MNQLLEQKLVTYLEKFEGAAEKAIDFSGEQVPLVIKEYLEFTFYENLITFSISSVIIFSALVFPFVVRYFIGKVVNTSSTAEMDKAFGAMFAAMLSVLILTLTVPDMLSSSTNMIKVKVAPRVLILEKVSDLTNGK